MNDLDRARDLLAGRAEALVNAAVGTLSDNANKRSRTALRRALGRAPEDPAARAAHMVVAPTLPSTADRATERAFYAVASMIAAQPRDARDETAGRNDESVAEADGNDGAESSQCGAAAEGSPEADGADSPPVRVSETLGATLGRWVATGKRPEDTTEARLHLICRQDLYGVHRHLPRLIATLRADLVPVDWVRLTVDLAQWDRNRDYVTKRWLQDYYRTLHAVRAAQAKNSTNCEGEDQ